MNNNGGVIKRIHPLMDNSIVNMQLKIKDLLKKKLDLTDDEINNISIPYTTVSKIIALRNERINYPVISTKDIFKILIMDGKLDKKYGRMK